MKIKTILTALFGVIVLTGCANKNDTKQASERNDTLEGFNRTMWKFNYNVMDRYVLEPAAKVGITMCLSRFLLALLASQIILMSQSVS